MLVKFASVTDTGASRWVPAEVVFSARFPSDLQFFNTIVTYLELFGNTSSELEQPANNNENNEKIKKAIG